MFITALKVCLQKTDIETWHGGKVFVNPVCI
jgi:hypothetical protein